MRFVNYPTPLAIHPDGKKTVSGSFINWILFYYTLLFHKHFHHILTNYSSILPARYIRNPQVIKNFIDFRLIQLTFMTNSISSSYYSPT